MTADSPARVSSVRRRRFVCLVLSLLCAVAAGCGGPRTSDARPILVLVSIDGFRADYFERLAPPALTRLAAGGVRARGLVPQFPSKTFPNHYTIVTGLTPAHHGIVSNNIVAPDIPGRFALSNREVLADPRWWGGEPIWNTAERQGVKAATLFWPGSETAIGGRRPSYWRPYDDDLPHAERVHQAVAWLAMPEASRPSLVTLYYSAVDSAGHSEGPGSEAVRRAVLDVDQSIGSLVARLEAAGLASRLHVIVVSDHGMAAVAPERHIVLDDYLDPARVDVIDWAPVLAIAPRAATEGASGAMTADEIYTALHGRHPALTVYRNAEIPASLGALAGHPRVPAVVGVADEGWYITSRREQARWARGEGHAPGGAHGYDPHLASMHGLFIASGPRFRPGVVIPTLENLDVYELMCAVLGLEPAQNDGDAARIRPLLREH